MSDWRQGKPRVGHADFGDFARQRPISTCYGYDRGTPIDRPYIEEFLERHRGDVKGRVLEVGDNAYTMRFGGERVAGSDVLHVREGTPGATIIADLAHAPHIPPDSFDSIILTQVLMLVFDLRAAIATIHRILKPGGVALLTVPGISNIEHDNWHDEWMWGFTSNSMRRLLHGSFQPANVTVEHRGNVFTAVSFLQGLSLEDIAGFDHRHDDHHYQLTILARAVK